MLSYETLTSVICHFNASYKYFFKKVDEFKNKTIPVWYFRSISEINLHLVLSWVQIGNA